MTALQKVNLGTAPTGTDGDTVRTANVKANANVDVLTTQAILTSSSPNAVRDLTAADMGKRINFTPTAAASSHFPAANTTGADQIVSVHNLSPTYDVTMAVAAGSGDTVPTIVVVKPGEMLTWETDGVSAWRTIGRKKAFDEVVQGKLTVAGALTTGGALSGQSLAIGAVASISAAGAYSGISAAYSGNVTVGGTLGVTSNATVGGTLGVTGLATFTLRPAFAGNTPWDSGNLASPASAVGVVDGSNAAAGRVGEYKEATLSGGGQAASGSVVNYMSLSLTAGDWDVEATGMVITSSSLNEFSFGISTTSSTFGGVGTYEADLSSVAANRVLVTPTVRISVSAATTVYAVGRITYSSATLTTAGLLRARRVR